MPDLGYRIKGFGWMKDYPSIKDYGPNTVEEKLLAEKHLVKETNSAQKIKSVLQTKGTSNKRTPSKIEDHIVLQLRIKAVLGVVQQIWLQACMSI